MKPAIARPLTREVVTSRPPAEFTHRSAVLVAVAVLAEERGMQPFRYGDLVMAAWEMFPSKFSLSDLAPDAPPHPDSNAILSKMLGSDGLVARKLLRASDTAARTWHPQRQLVEAAREVLYGPAPVPVPRRAPPPPPVPAPKPEPPVALARPAKARMTPEGARLARAAAPWPLNMAR